MDKYAMRHIEADGEEEVEDEEEDEEETDDYSRSYDPRAAYWRKRDGYR